MSEMKPLISDQDLKRALLRPDLSVELLLSRWGHVCGNISAGLHLRWLIALQLLTSLCFILPYGAVLGPEAAYRVPLLFLGSIAICLPSLYIFSAFIGHAFTPRQTLSLALIQTSTAAIFTLGFAPILWFLGHITRGAETLAGLSALLLTLSALASLLHLNRSLYAQGGLGVSRPFAALILAWQGLLLFITLRMAALLGLV